MDELRSFPRDKLEQKQQKASKMTFCIGKTWLNYA